MNKILEKFAGNTVFANIVLITIFIAGGIAASMMIKEEMPNMSLDKVVISVAYPGADPEEVEEGVSRKVEEAIEGIEGIDSYTSSSSENSCSVIVNVKKGYDTGKLVDSIKNEIDSLQDLPDDSETPVVSEPIIKHSVMTLFIKGDMSERRMKEWGSQIEDEILKLPEVSQVDIATTREYEISVEVSEVKLREYGLTLSDVSSAIKKSSLNKSGGTIKTNNEEIRVRTLGRKYSGIELSDIVVIANKEGELITLDKIATIKDSFVDDKLKTRINEKPAVIIDIFKTELEDSITIADAVKKYLSEKQKMLPEGSEIGVLADNSLKTKKTISILLKNGFIGLLLVFSILWFFLDTRLSFWAGMGIPVSLVGGVAILWFTGNTFNMLTLFGLIMVLGIVADDAIIVGEAIYVQRQKGVPPLQAAVNGVSEVGMPVVAAVLTTIVAFIPLAHIDGVLGKFVACLPVAVISCLAISLIECLILLPAHLSELPDPNKKKKPKNVILKYIDKVHTFTSEGMEKFSDKIYRPFIERIIKYRYLLVSSSVMVLLLTAGMFMGGFIKYQVFPSRDGYVVTADIEYPEGTTFETTEKAVEKIEAAAKRLAVKIKTKSGDPLIKNIYSLYGQSLGEGLGSSGSKKSNLAGVRLILLNAEDRGIHTQDLNIMWQKEVGDIPGVKSLTFVSDGKGPPGAPVEICVDGKNFDSINAAEKKILAKLTKIKGTTQVWSDNSPGKNVITFTLKEDARAYGLTVNDLASQVYNGYYGEEAVSVQRGDENIKVYVRYSDDERKRYSSIENFMIRTDKNYKIPLNLVANIHYGPGYSTITRADGYRRVKVSAEIDATMISAGDIIQDLSKNFFSDIEAEYPDVNIVIKGDSKRNDKTFSSLYIWFPLAVFGIYMIVATMFTSYIQPFVILTSIPFGLIGALWGHYLLGHVISMLSIFGMVALTGVVVNDAIVLIDRINQNMKEGVPFIDAVTMAGVRRFRAVMLTSISTVAGLLPLIIESSPDAQMLIPMAISLAAGVIMATVLTLVLIPCLMVILNDLRLAWCILVHGEWKTREEVEPKYKTEESVTTITETEPVIKMG
ncbi:MAG: efflux RND transporter permease subunit [Desulfobacterales bacterium]|nr:efflux RND transporter permease subunit [Desulfobacterales bacterium]